MCPGFCLIGYLTVRDTGGNLQAGYIAIELTNRSAAAGWQV